MTFNDQVREICQRGSCNGDNRTIKEGFKFQPKTYSGEDAQMIERFGFARTQIFDSQGLDGSRTLGGEETGAAIVTIIPGMKAGDQKLMRAERYDGPNWVGELDGVLPNQCTYVPGSSRRVIEDERVMCVKEVQIGDKICPKQLLETVKRKEMLPGFQGSFKDSGFLDNIVINAMLEANHRNTDRHAFQGDYGSDDNRVKHMDGFLKILSQAYNVSQGQGVQYKFVGDYTNAYIVGLSGGQSFELSFDTDLDVTLGKLADYLRAKLENFTMKPLFKKVEYRGTGILYVEAWEGRMVELNFAVSSEAGAAVKTCANGAIESCKPADQSLYVSATETQESVTRLSPIGVPVRAVNKHNVEEILDDWYETVNQVDPEQLEDGFGLNLLVARNIYNAWQAKFRKIRQARMEDGGISVREKDIPTFYQGFIRMIPINALPKNFFMAARPQDLLVGTDLSTDPGTFRTWIDDDCQDIKYQGGLTLGFQVMRVDKVSGTFCENDKYFRFQKPMPCAIKRNDKLQPINVDGFTPAIISGGNSIT